jgi:hypothetical protein
MHLLLRRSQRDDGIIWSSVVFTLDARLELSAEEEYLFSKYNLHSLVVYDSDARIEHADAAYTHFDEVSKLPLWEPSFTELATSLWNNVAGLAHTVMTVLSLRVTLSDLIASIHVEAEDLHQLLQVESNVSQAAEYLSNYFSVALTFDGGEELREI